MSSKPINPLLAEQTKLLQAKKHIKELISHINEQINELKVEELQIKSNIATENLNSTSYRKDGEEKEITNNIYDEPEEINKQTLDLDMFAMNVLNSIDSENDEIDD